ncbi:MAG TPA: thioredoxin [Syntrophales bacterium]|jgi:thioredoxin 1|nr:thioredoxin [Syntrophales bacterium]HON24120.1 thioredoxin [Syntrophales bacterium]HOU77766.1 thioredoxin [Syntrophales bacterium]HPC32865.1 thioredoxin [Syntrophales bacterium]HQG34915.1 thioredoxin [Syntrophales bacterium]
MAEDIKHVGDNDFDQEVIKSDIPAIVDFWAPWCGPCRALGPLVEELAAGYKGRVKVTKLNIDESPLTAEKYGVRSIPTLILFKDGQVLDTLIGLVPKDKLEAFAKKGL